MASPTAVPLQPGLREEADVCIVGAGPTGLAAATRLRQLGVERVLLVEREKVAGGIPRHSQHTGYGLGDMHRLLSGPRYAQRLVASALATGATLRVATSALDWNDDGSLVLVAPSGISSLKARAVLLAAGCRERPRSARLVPGTRGAGVFTTGQLQQWVYLNHWPVGRRAVVVGAEHVSFSALMTLRHAGVEPVAMVTEHPRHQTLAPLRWVTATARGVPVLTGRVVVAIAGRTRVESLALRDVLTGEVQEIPCDTVVFTGDFVAESELARRGGIALGTGPRALVIDASQRTSREGVFAAGNVVHPAETASAAARCGDLAARAVYKYLTSGAWPSREPITMIPESPIAWVSPSAIRPGESHIPHGHYLLRVSRFIDSARLEICQGDSLLWTQAYKNMTPGRSVHVKGGWEASARADGGPVSLRVRTLQRLG